MTGLMCRIFGHRVERKRVRRLGNTWVGRCRHCGVEMAKIDGVWQERELVS